MDYQINQPIDLSGNEQCIKITTKQGDMNSRHCSFILMKDGTKFLPPDGTTARISWRKPDGTQVLQDAVLESGQVSFTLTQQMLAAPGEAKCEVMLFQGEELLSSGVLTAVVMPVGYDYDEVESSDEYQTFINALQAVEPSIRNCTNAAETANAAAKSASEHAQEADTAAKSASENSQKASAAATAANEAATSASAAAKSANTNSQAAEAAADRANAAAQLVENTDFSDIMFRMGPTCSEITGSLNDVKTSGWYYGNLEKTTNTPPNGGSVFYVLLVYKISPSLVLQDVYFCGLTPVRYTRTYRLQSDSTTIGWGSWYRLASPTVVT